MAWERCILHADLDAFFASVEQLDTNLDALSGPTLTDDELAEIDRHAVESGINLWAKQTEE